jgi:cell division protein FtsL
VIKNFFQNIKPFFSIFFILMTLFGLVYVKMENRRMGYVLLNMAQKEKTLREQQRLAVARLANMTNSDRVRKIATGRMTFQNAKEGQVIRVAGKGTALIK